MTANNAINTDSHEQGSFVALLMAAGYGERSASRSRLLSYMALVQSTPKGGALCHVNGLLQ
jgi:hypothetical protein